MTQQVAEFGAALLALILNVALFVGGLWPAFALADRLEKSGPLDRGGWAAVILLGMAGVILLTLLFGPAIHVLESYSCRSAADYAECMDPPDRDPL